MQERVFEVAGLRVTVEMPDAVPESVALDVDVDFRPKTEADTRAAIEAFGGLPSFEEPYSTASARWLYLRGARFSSKGLTVQLHVPEETRPEPPPEFAAELVREQERETEERRRELRDAVQRGGSYEDVLCGRIVGQLLEGGVRPEDVTGDRIDAIVAKLDEEQRERNRQAVLMQIEDPELVRRVEAAEEGEAKDELLREARRRGIAVAA